MDVGLAEGMSLRYDGETASIQAFRGGSMASERFKGRTAVVTGGARGIGLACAAKIVAGGGRVALWDRDIDRARQSAASLGAAIAVQVDVTSEPSLAAALATTEDQLSPP